MSQVVYAFELRGIQGYLFNTGRLKDMIYASELIDYVFYKPLDAALELVGFDSARPQPRRAGGAAYLVLDSLEQATRLRNVWTLYILQLLPGIELVDAIAIGASVKEAVSHALDELQVARNRPLAQWPGATPLTALAPRTGEPAVDNDRGESLDASTATRRHAQPNEAGLMGRFGDGSLKWPNNFEEDSHESRRFRLNADNFVGMLHLDGNGIGVVLRTLNEAAAELNDADYIKAYQTFSTGLGKVTCQAAQKATREILEPAISDKGVIPARPLVLGGDDLTMLLRSDLAIPFAMSYASHFEELSRGFIKELKQLLNTENFPESLSVSGGLVLVKPGFPFSQALSLAESFAGIAKAKGTAKMTEGNETLERKYSTLALYRIQGAVGDDAGALFEREQRVADIELSLPAYALTNHKQDGMPSLQTLLSLVKVCMAPTFSKARLRSLVGLMYESQDLAQADYNRWRGLMQKNEATRSTWFQFESGLTELLGSLDNDLPCSAKHEGSLYRPSPLNDLLLLLETEMASPLNTEEVEHHVA